ncbi:peptidylprolyl isomerase [Candidatus Woesearchaeota archaeon]|nr:peptidylprolyl isomerase [Candidatus Woesearchaeota archaeon]
MAKIKKGDFVEVEYTGKIKEIDEVFDTTNEELAKETGLHNPHMVYGPVAVCIGEARILKGIDDELIGKETGKDYKIELSPEKGFGKKDAKLFKVIPFSTFKKNKIVPEQGMQVNIDGMMGIIKRATGGRCMVDFNHPLAGKTLVYDIKVNKIVADDSEKIKSFLRLELGVKDADVKIEEGNAKVVLEKELPEKAREMLSGKLAELIPSVKKISFSGKDETKK